MKAFKFTLQALLTLREQQEQNALQDYGQKLNDQTRAVSLLESTQLELEDARDHFQSRLAEGCNATELWQLQAWCDSLQRRVAERSRLAQQARNHARLAFSRLLAARHATGVVHKLLEEQKRRHKQEQRRHEQKILDDLSQRRNLMMLFSQMKNHSFWN